MRYEISKIYRTEGIGAFYRGVSSVIPTIFVPAMVYFSSYETLNYYGKQYLKTKKQENLNYLLPLVTATVSEGLALIFFLPFDIIRTRWQLNTREYDYKNVS